MVAFLVVVSLVLVAYQIVVDVRRREYWLPVAFVVACWVLLVARS